MWLMRGKNLRGYFLLRGLWRCGFGWGRIFSVGLCNGVVCLIELLYCKFLVFW